MVLIGNSMGGMVSLIQAAHALLSVESLILVDAAFPRTVRQSFDHATRAFLDAARSIFRAQVAPGRYRALARSVTGPALVIHGARDRLVPVGAAREAVDEHPNWKLIVFDDLGHIPQIEAPGRWLAVADEWLDAHEKKDQAAIG